MPHTCLSLLDLPNELLLIISEDLDDDELLHMASTCARLNLLLVPSVFARCDFEVPSSSSGSIESISVTGDNLRFIPALGITSFITSIDVIDCAFTALYKKISSKEIIDAAKGLQALARRLRHFGHLRFNPAVNLSSLTTDQLSRWMLAVAGFLNSASQRGDCTITVCSALDQDFRDPRPFSHSIPPVPRLDARAPPQVAFSARDIIQSLTAALGSLFGSLKYTAKVASTQPAVEPLPATPVLQSTQRPSHVALPLVAHSALTTFNIHSSFLFHASFYKWTLHTLNTSPITALSLDCIDLSHYDWNLTLPSLTLPALTTLVIAQCAIAVPDLSLFLARHPSILTLDLSFHLAIGPLVPHATTPVLPHLSCIRATPDYLLYFLAQGDAWYADLGRVGITSDDESVYETRQFERVVECLRRRHVLPRVALTGKLAKHCEVPTMN
ncbi:hypothetical protein FB451DRAFT_47307 [Mycena latifolia]|nr:hypothetical protein FB451DRAFT_47307 [Mycena latifolia]